jgi:hypothetical protein
MDDGMNDIEFNELLEEKRHRDLTVALRNIATSLNQPKSDVVAEAIRQNNEATRGLIEAVKNLPKPEKPEVNVQVDNQKIITSLEDICGKIVASNKEVLEALKNKPMVHSFQVKPSGWNNTEKTINVIYQPASQITIKK